MIIDLHCHSNCSDGELSAKELIKLAEVSNIKILSITDHDNVDAYKELKKINTTIKIVPGIEFSTSWNKIGIHVIGLNVNLESKALKDAIKIQKQSRVNRAKIISKRLVKHGLVNSFEKLQSSNKNKQIGRPDFAKLLIKEGVVKNWDQAFKKYLGSGKAGDVKNSWLSLPEIIKAILCAGGIPVLAHPLYYKLTNSKLRRLLTDFKSFGGVGLEVLNGYQNPDKTQYLKDLCSEFNLKASIGSDFHAPTKWSKLGCETNIFTGRDVVWENF